MSTEQHGVAILAALNAVLPASMAAYDLDDLAKLATKPDNYVEVTVSRRYGGDRRNAGAKSATGWRITTRVVAKTISNARLIEDHCKTALENVRLTVGAETSTAVEFETAEIVGPDDGYFSGLTAWIYAL